MQLYCITISQQGMDMTSNKHIVIIGSGWLSWPLAQHLSDLGHHVTATTRTTEKAQRLTSETLPVIQLSSDDVENIAPLILLKHCQVMVIAIPPQHQKDDYFNQLQQLLKLAEKLNITNVLFISSTSVYGHQTAILTAQSQTKPNSAAAHAMANFEQLLLKNKSQHSVLRLAGLINDTRHPGRFLAGKIDVSNPDAVVNMIHQADCIGIISQIIKQAAWGEIHLGCAPSHPTRRQFYQLAAQTLELTPPQFVNQGGTDAKQIDASASAAQLNYQYQHPDLMQWLITRQ